MSATVPVIASGKTDKVQVTASAAGALPGGPPAGTSVVSAGLLNFVSGPKATGRAKVLKLKPGEVSPAVTSDVPLAPHRQVDQEGRRRPTGSSGSTSAPGSRSR